MFKGTYTALVTPFKKGQIDEEALERLIEKQAAAGVDGIVPVGTTGESPALNYEEHIRVIERSVAFANGRLKVIAGTGANSTSEAIYLTEAAEAAGADGSLQVAPYYNKPTQAGLFQHFQAVARATRLPILLYSVPSRCGIEIGVETMRKLAERCSNIIGVKESGGAAERVTEIRAAIGNDFTVLCGDDLLTLPFLSVGAAGVVSVASNIVPKEVAKLIHEFQGGRFRGALKCHESLYPIFRDLFLETNPIPVKAALAMMGLIREEYRLPLVPLRSKNRVALRATLNNFGLLP